MGYRSNIVIGITKKVLARDLISNEIPACLKEEKYQETENNVYWTLEGWEWYDRYPSIQSIEQWFEDMALEEFGALRIGEDDDDCQSWGSPWDFEIHLHRSIVSPV